MSVKRINAGPRMSSAVVHGDTVYLAGLTADDAKADVKGQTKQILDKIDKFLAEAGTDKSKILSANIWLTDIGTWGQMNEVWDAWVAPGNTPARPLRACRAVAANMSPIDDWFANSRRTRPTE